MPWGAWAALEVIYSLACVAMLLVTYVLHMTYTSIFYHRAICHGAVVLRPGVLRAVVRSGMWVTGVDAKAWVCMHRRHHVHADTPLDPHSPRYQGLFGLYVGQFLSYCRTVDRLRANDPAYTAVVADLPFEMSPLVMSRVWWWLPYGVHTAIALAVAIGLHWPLLAACYWFGMMSHPFEGWLVNSLGHAIGYRNFETTDGSRNNTLVGWYAMGEGYQNNHHHDPSRANFAVKRGEVDWGYGVVRALAALGLVALA